MDSTRLDGLTAPYRRFSYWIDKYLHRLTDLLTADFSQTIHNNSMYGVYRVYISASVLSTLSKKSSTVTPSYRSPFIS